MSFLNDIMVANKLAPNIKEYNPVTQTIAEASSFVGSGVSPLQNTEDYLRTYATLEWVYRCVYVKQANIAKLPIQIFTGKDNDKKDITDNPNFKLFDKPHPFKTRFMFWMEAIGHLELTGELFVYLVRNNENQAPQGMIPLRPDRIKIVTDSQNYIGGYLYNVNGQDVPFETWEIFHINYFNPTDDYRGLSPLQAARDDLILELNAVQYSKDFFANGARPSGVLQTKQRLDDKQFRRLKKEVNQQYSGTGKQFKIMLLESETEFKPIALPPKDVEFIEQRKLTKAAVLSTFGVPPLMVMDLSDSSVLQNTEIQRRLFWEETMSPLMQMFMQEWNTELLPLFGVKGAYAEWDISGVTALQEKQEEKEKRYFEGFNKGAVTPNDIRVDVFGKDPLNDSTMNSTYLPLNVLPVATDKNIKALVLKSSDDETKKIAQWRTFVARVIPLERKYEPELAKMFNELGKEVVKNWKKSNKDYNKKEAIQELFNEETWKQKFKDAENPFLIEAIKKGALSVLDDLGSDVVFNLTDPFVKELIKTRLEYFGTEVIGTTQKQIAQVIADGMANNKTVEEVADLLKTKFDLAEKVRAPRIARTEMSTGFNAGNNEGMRQSQSVDEHMWLSSRDDDVRDAHKKLDGIQVKIGEPFPGYTDGWDTAYPSSINERCTTIPARKE